MSTLQIEGGYRLSGRLRMEGAKNALLPILSACLMVRGPVILHDVPKITDINNLLHIMARCGVRIHRQGQSLKIEATTLTTHQITTDAAQKIRGSIFVMGALLARTGQVELPFPGGCAIGARPIDLHLTLLRQIGAQIKIKNQTISANLPPRHWRKTKIITLDFPSVGATENIIQATALGPAGNTYQIYGAAKEPEVVDLCQFLNACGAQISGAGTDIITVRSVANLHGTTYTPIPDRINTGSYLLAAAVTHGEIFLENVVPEHNTNLLGKLAQLGAKITTTESTIHLVMPKWRRTKLHLHTAPYPGFPTDLQSQFAVLATLLPGQTIITETLFENRFRYLTELKKFGAKITLDGNQAVIKGVPRLTAGTTSTLCPTAYQIPVAEVCQGLSVTATDLRGGVALVLAALAASGTTTIHQAEYIARGHSDIVKDLRQLGARINSLVE